MRVSHVAPISAMLAVNLGPTYTFFDGVLKTDYSEYMLGLRENCRVLQVYQGEAVHPRADILFFSESTLNSVNIDSNVRKGVIVSNYESYISAANSDSVDIIAVRDSGGSRIPFIRKIVYDGVFVKEKEHILYGLCNPAEISWYYANFSSFIVSRITTAITASCYWFSTFGVGYSESCGLLRTIPNCPDNKPNLDYQKVLDYMPSRDQIREFAFNKHLLDNIAKGAIKITDFGGLGDV